jgi:bacterial/archaeal transporter family protein
VKPWILYALLSMLFAGVTSVIAKFGMKNVSGDAALAVRTSAVFLLVWFNTIAFQHTQQLSKLTRSDYMFLFLSGVTTTFSWLFYYRAIKAGDVSVVASIDKASIVLTILLSIFLLREPFTLKLALGAGLIILGTLILAWK